MKAKTARQQWPTTAQIQELAKQLRREQTPAEARLWQQLRGQRLNGLGFRRQHPVGRFILDFYCPAARLVIEVDGDTHAEQEAYDADRTKWLQEQGYQVIRFSNREIYEQMGAVLEEIAAAAEKGCAPGTPPRDPEAVQIG